MIAYTTDYCTFLVLYLDNKGIRYQLMSSTCVVFRLVECFLMADITFFSVTLKSSLCVETVLYSSAIYLMPSLLFSRSFCPLLLLLISHVQIDLFLFTMLIVLCGCILLLEKRKIKIPKTFSNEKVQKEISRKNILKVTSQIW